MVPSDPRTQLVRRPACTVRTRRAETRWQLPPSLPTTAFDRCGSMLRKPPNESFRRSRRLEMTFRSPAANARFRATSARSPFPAYFFDALPDTSFGPFSYGLLPSPLGFPMRGKSQSVARYRYPARFVHRTPPVLLLFGTFRSLWISARPVRHRRLAST